MTGTRYYARLMAVIALAATMAACGPAGGPQPTQPPGGVPTLDGSGASTEALTEAVPTVEGAAEIPTAPPAACTPPTGDASVTGSWAVYCNATYGFGFRYPPFGDAVYSGSGPLNLPFAEGTNLLEKYLDIAVSNGEAVCASPQAQGQDPNTIPTETVDFNGVSFVHQNGTGAAAGNAYHWEGYSTTQGSLCVSLTFILHSANIENYTTPTAEYDAAAESAAFGQMMNTFFWPIP